MTRHFARLVAGIAMAFGLSMSAHAALLGCPASFTSDGTAKVTHDGSTDTAASACQYLDPADQSNVASLANINTAAFFGHSDWTLNGGNLQVGPGGASGTWTLAGPVDFATNDYMIVFKDGADTNLIAFLLNEETSSGDWTTPFTEPPFDFTGGSTAHNVSHYTIVQRVGDDVDPPQEIAEPASLALAGLALVGLGLARRARRSQG